MVLPKWKAGAIAPLSLLHACPPDMLQGWSFTPCLCPTHSPRQSCSKGSLSGYPDVRSIQELGAQWEDVESQEGLRGWWALSCTPLWPGFYSSD